MENAEYEYAEYEYAKGAVWQTGPFGPELMFDDEPRGLAGDWVFRTDDEGNVIAESPPPNFVRVTAELLDEESSLFPIVQRGRLVYVTAINCRCVYRLASWRPGDRTYLCRLAQIFSYFLIPTG